MNLMILLSKETCVECIFHSVRVFFSSKSGFNTLIFTWIHAPASDNSVNVYFVAKMAKLQGKLFDSSIFQGD